MKKERIAVLYGGRSAEHEISVITALQCMQAMDTRRYEILPVYLALNGKWYTGEKLFDKSFYRKFSSLCSQVDEVTLLPDPAIGGFIRLKGHERIPVDVCFLAFHGQLGEDGSVQGLLELADLPFTGCGVCASALSMNKHLAKLAVQAGGIPVLPSVLADKKEAFAHFSAVKEKVENTLRYPLFVKPNHLGSSIGIAHANNGEELNAALAKVFQYDDQALIEPRLEELMEINAAVLDGDPPRVSPVEVPVASGGILSYEDKYLSGGSKITGSQGTGMAGLSRLIDPSDLDSEIKCRIMDFALRAFKLLNCSGVCRFDFMFDLHNGALYFNEVNPIPGSFAYYLWVKAKPRLLFTDLIEHLLHLAKQRKALQRSLNTEFGFHAL